MQPSAHQESPDAIRHHAMIRRQRGPVRMKIYGELKNGFQGGDEK